MVSKRREVSFDSALEAREFKIIESGSFSRGGHPNMEDEQGLVPSPLSTAVLVTSPVLQEKLSPCQRPDTLKTKFSVNSLVCLNHSVCDVGAAGLSTWKSRNYLQVRVQLRDTQVSPAWHVGNSACIRS